MRLLADRILVLRDSSESKTASGIIIPDQSVKKKNTGTVKAVGPGTPKKPMELKEGDRVSFGPHAGHEVDVDGVTHLIMRDTDVIFVH